MRRLRRSVVASVAAVVCTGLAGVAHAGGGDLESADGLWTAEIDGFGQLLGLTPDVGFDRVSESYLFDANTDTSMVCRRVESNYSVDVGPIIDPDLTHAFTRLLNAVGNGPAPSGDCCTAHPEAGCEDAACEAGVCGIDSFCCDVEWDDTCAEIADGAPGCDCSPAPPPIAIEIEQFMIDGADGGVLNVYRAINESLTDSIQVKLFCYIDLDIGSPQDDEAAPIFAGELVAIEQAVFPDQQAMWFGGCPSYDSWEIDVWPALIQDLDAGVTTLDSADHTTPGADDHSAALASAAVTLGPGEAFELSVGLGGVSFAGCASTPCPWDIDGGGSVGTSDLLALLAAWGPNPGHPADFDGNNSVGTSDLLKLLANWGACP